MDWFGRIVKKAAYIDERTGLEVLDQASDQARMRRIVEIVKRLAGTYQRLLPIIKYHGPIDYGDIYEYVNKLPDGHLAKLEAAVGLQPVMPQQAPGEETAELPAVKPPQPSAPGTPMRPGPKQPLSTQAPPPPPSGKIVPERKAPKNKLFRKRRPQGFMDFLGL